MRVRIGLLGLAVSGSAGRTFFADVPFTARSNYSQKLMTKVKVPVGQGRLSRRPHQRLRLQGIFGGQNSSILGGDQMPTAENPSLKPKQDDFLTIIRRQQLGKLKVYLGACAGVGKTYQMLIEGNRLRRQGVDVVIGYVEPHDRPETTAQIGDLEIVPPLVAKYHGITLKEMDLDAVIARKPTVALVDELAHTNAPQSRNRKR
jgi:hypothetical protein